MTIVRKHKRKLKRGYTKVKQHKRKVRKKMAHFTIDKEKELMDINWDKNQKGKKIGSGHFGDVFEVKDNPKYVLKVPKFPNQYYGSTTDEMRKFDSFGDADIVAPSFHSTQGIVRDNLKIVSRGATKQDWDNKTKGLSGYTVFNKDIDKDQTQKIIKGINELSKRGILVGDELQIGISKEGEPYLYDIGTLRKQKQINVDNYARDDNDDYKQRFLEGVGHQDLFDRDRDAEMKQAIKEIKG